jgi:hypothetical protein
MQPPKGVGAAATLVIKIIKIAFKLIFNSD